jgi:uncharacterized protein
MVCFEYDKEKSAQNSNKHGIDFEIAKAIWEDPYYLEIPANVSSEKRYMIIGKIEDKHWSAIATYRGSKVRIISARRSRKEEVEYYGSERF